jgi:hypothetical protein
MRDARFWGGGIRMLLAVVTIASLARPAAAQVVELGGGVSRGCTGDSSGFCSDETGPMWSMHGGLWASTRWLISLRVAALPLPDFRYTTHRDERFNYAADPAARSLPRIDIMTRQRNRQIIGGEALYHFAGARRFGGVLGVGIGDLRNPRTLSCEPAGCEAVLTALGEEVGRAGGRGVRNLTGIAGLSGPVWNRLHISAGIRLHNFAGENLSTAEAYLTTGIRFGSF